MMVKPAGQRLQSHRRRAGVGPQGYAAERQRLCRWGPGGVLGGRHDSQADREFAVRRQFRLQPPGRRGLEGQY